MSNTFLTHYLFGFKWWFELVSLWTKSQSVTIQMNDTKQYVPVVLSIMLYNVILTFESVDEILKWDHSNEWYWVATSCGSVNHAVQGGANFWVSGRNPKVCPFKWTLLSSTLLWYSVHFAVQGGSNFWVLGRNPTVWPLKWTVLSSDFLWYCLLCRTRLLSVNEILKCDHSDEGHYRAVLSCGKVYNVVQADCKAWHGEKYPVAITLISSSAVATKMTSLTGCHSPISPECSHPSSSIASFVFFSS